MCVCPLLSHVSLILPSNHNCLFLPQKLHQVLVQLQSGDKEQDFSLAPIQVSISVQLWRLPGCHEFLAALGESSTEGTKKKKKKESDAPKTSGVLLTCVVSMMKYVR